jgi:hypothetical protein
MKPGWTFEIEEVSTSVYRIRGRNTLGACVDLVGSDPVILAQEANEAAKELDIRQHLSSDD